jgi:hypothetical protein
MKPLLARLVLAFALVSAGRAAPITRNLGQGLTFHRVHQLPADLPVDADARRTPCVLDLRYVTGGDDEASALAAWLKSHATTKAPVFILANAATSAALRAAITVVPPRAAGASVLLVGATTADFAPDIAVTVSAEAERRAYDALERGVATDSLLSENSDKPRNDEASLAKERVPEPIAAPDLPASPPSAGPNDAAKPKPPMPIIDPVLQRAVQVHRAMLALKKL